MSQLAQVLNSFRQNVAATAGSGLSRAGKSYFGAKERQQERAQQKELFDLKKTSLKQDIDQTKVDQAKEALFPIIAAGIQGGPEGWEEKQLAGLVPDDMDYNDAEAFMMSYMGEDALKTTEVGVEGTDRTEFVRPWEVAGQPGKPRKPLVQVGGELETGEQKAKGAANVKAWETIRDDAALSEKSLMQYNIAKNIDVNQSGPLQAWKMSIGALADDMGIDPATLGLENIDNDYGYQGIMQNMVLTKMQAQKGPQTENDAKRIEATLATIGNPEEARKFLLDAGMAMEQMNVDKRDFYENYWTTNGTYEGASSKWNNFRKKTPFLAKNPKTGRPVFFTQFVEQVQAVNPNARYPDIVNLWQKKYGRTN